MFALLIDVLTYEGVKYQNDSKSAPEWATHVNSQDAAFDSKQCKKQRLPFATDDSKFKKSFTTHASSSDQVSSWNSLDFPTCPTDENSELMMLRSGDRCTTAFGQCRSPIEMSHTVPDRNVTMVSFPGIECQSFD